MKCRELDTFIEAKRRSVVAALKGRENVEGLPMDRGFLLGMMKDYCDHGTIL